MRNESRSRSPLRRAARRCRRCAGRMLLRRFLRHRLGVVSAACWCCSRWPAWRRPWSRRCSATIPNLVDLFGRFAAPSASHPLGTDELGRDLLLRLLYGGQVSLFVGLVGAVAASVLGTLIGVVAGYLGGRVDALLMRLTDAVIALPLLPLLIVLAAVDLTSSASRRIWRTPRAPASIASSLIMALAGWTTVARLVRGAVLSVREHDFVRAAVALGARPVRIMVGAYPAQHRLADHRRDHLSVGGVILTELVLSFLGLGIQPPLPSWGNMLTNAQELIWRRRSSRSIRACSSSSR